jgi:AraC family transcriptional regulator
LALSSAIQHRQAVQNTAFRENGVNTGIDVLGVGNKMTIEAERDVPIASLQIVHFDWSQPIETISHASANYRVDQCLTPRPNARARFKEFWAPNRFERIGDILLLPPGQSIHTRCDEGHQESMVCEVHADAMSQWLDQDLEWTDQRLEAGLDVRNPNLRALMTRMGEEMRHPGFASEALLELMSGQVAIELCRYYASLDQSKAAGGLAPWRLRAIDERLNEVSQAPTLAELASLCRLSVRQLTRAFRSSRNCSIGDYIEQRRVDVAKRLLQTDACIKAIAHSMGFSSPSSFSYAFRRATGTTPRQFSARARHFGDA